MNRILNVNLNFQNVDEGGGDRYIMILYNIVLTVGDNLVCALTVSFNKHGLGRNVRSA